jgi:hypothetical protein
MNGGDLMINQIPIFLRNSREFNEIFDAEGKQIALLNTDIEDIKSQLTVSTATWLLPVYERELGMPVDTNKPIADRRSAIIGKMRGTGKLDAMLIKLVALAFTGGLIDVVFDGKIKITFVDIVGIPNNIQDFYDVMEEIKPAGLAINYFFRWLQWNELDAYAMHWDEIDSLAMTWDQFEAWKPTGEIWLDVTANDEAYLLDDATIWDDTLTTGGTMINYLFGLTG